MKIRVLGTGTSTGVPVPGCQCSVCQSTDPYNERLRCSVYIESDCGQGLLIDTTPDLRQQALRYSISRVDGVLFTHSHADHVFGLDDLRCFTFGRAAPLSVYADEATSADLRHKFDYVFASKTTYEGGSPPRLQLKNIEHYRPIEVCGLEVNPLSIMHGSMPTLGFRVGPFAYLTDCSEIPKRSKEQLQGLEVLIIDGLRDRPHKTHFTQEQAVREVEQLRPKKSYLTHISHEIDHHEANRKIQKLTALSVELAYDGLLIEL